MWSTACVWFSLIAVLNSSSFAKLVEENETVVQVWCSENLRNLIANKLEDLDRKIELLDLKLSTKTTTTVESKPPDIQQLIANSVKDYQNQIVLESISQNVKEMQRNQKDILAQISKLNETMNTQLALQQKQLKGLKNVKEAVPKEPNDVEILTTNAGQNENIIDEILRLRNQMMEDFNSLTTRNEYNHNYNQEVLNQLYENERNLLRDVQRQMTESFAENYEHQKSMHKQTLDYIDNGLIKNWTCSISKDDDNSTIEDSVEFLKESSFESCAGALAGDAPSGVYRLSLPRSGLPPFDAYCLADPSDGIGWTIIQRRQDGSVEFYRSWIDYKVGFGNIQGEYWLGLEKIYAMTSKQPHELWIKLINQKKQERNARFDLFEIGNENESYYLKTVGKYSGNAGDSLGSGNLTRKFTTFDADNDEDSSRNCAEKFRGAWWYDTCNWSDLNGQYNAKYNTRNGQGINWSTWLGYQHTMKYVHMAIRPVK